MPSDLIRVLYKYLPTLLHFASIQLANYLKSIPHQFAYKRTSNPRTIVILGGSFAGIQLVKRLSQTLPSGFRIILVEKNSHFNYTFNFPRYAVARGREHKAFIPYTGLVNGAPEGMLEVVRDEVLGIDGNEVILGSGDRVEFEYLAIATGTTSYLPAKVHSTVKKEGCAELRGLQGKIEDAKSVVIVGGGAVGVQIATDIKSYCPDKRVALVHSRGQLLPLFGPRLHDYVMQVLEKIDVEVILNHRPALPEKNTDGLDIDIKEGQTSHYDLVIPCTGQTPNSSFLTSFSPSSISAISSHILVSPTLQILSSTSSTAPSQSPNPTIFALGDVAQTGGPKMARAGLLQAEIVCSNILSLIRAKSKSEFESKFVQELKLKEYVPLPLEGSLKLSLGREKTIMYMQDEQEEFLIEAKGGGEDLNLGQIVGYLGVRDLDLDLEV